MNEKIGPATGEPRTSIELTNTNRAPKYNNLDGPPVGETMSEIGDFVFGLIPEFSEKAPKSFCVKAQYSDHTVVYDFVVGDDKVKLASISFEGPIGHPPTKILE